MAIPETVFCNMLQREFEATVALIDTALITPVAALRILKSTLKRFENLSLAVVEVALRIIENKILTIIDLQRTDELNRLQDTRRAFCITAYNCEALFKILFPANGNDPAFVSSVIPIGIRDTIRNINNSDSFELFEKYVCKLSLKSMINQFILTLIDELETQLNELLSQLGTEFINKAIQKYMDVIGPFIPNLTLLDRFKNCVFAGCNFVQTARNKESDVADKLLISKLEGNSWTFQSDNYIESLFQKERELRLRINRLIVQLNNSKTSSSGPKPDEIMRI